MTSERHIAVVGTLDTKGEALEYLRNKIDDQGCLPILIDISMKKHMAYKADIEAREVVAKAGYKIEEIWESRDRAHASEVMKRGLRVVLHELLRNKAINAAVGIGGVSLANIAADAFKVLPFGMPKIIGVTAAMPVYSSSWFNAQDLAVFQTIVEIAGLNDLLKAQLDIIAGVACGAARAYNNVFGIKLPHPSVAITDRYRACRINRSCFRRKQGRNFRATGCSS